MSDKARDDFEEEYPVPTGVYWCELRNEYLWSDYFWSDEASRQQCKFEIWLAAKEKYEPRNCEWLYDEDTDSYDTQCGGKFQTIADSIEDNGIDFCCYCGGEIQDAPGTQGGGELAQ